MYIQRYTVVQRYSVVHLGLYLHACLCLLLPHHQPNPISASKFIYRYAYVRTQMYKQHVLTCIVQDRLACIWLISTRQEYACGSYHPHARPSMHLADIYMHTIASFCLIVRPSFSMHANVYIFTCALYVLTIFIFGQICINTLAFSLAHRPTIQCTYTCTHMYIVTYDIYIIYISGYFNFLSCFIVSRPSSSM